MGLNRRRSLVRLPRAAREILQYLAEHPDGVDTIEGILKWWLPGSANDKRREDIQQALDFLVRKGLLIERELPSPKIYGVNKARIAEIIAVLRKPAHCPEAENEWD